MTRPRAELADGIIRVDWPDTGERALLDLDELTALLDVVHRYADAYVATVPAQPGHLARTIAVTFPRPNRDPYTAELTPAEVGALEVELRAAHLGAAHRRHPPAARLPYTDDPETP